MSSYSNSNSSMVCELFGFLLNCSENTVCLLFFKESFVLCANHIARFYIIYFKNKRPTETRVNLKKRFD